MKSPFSETSALEASNHPGLGVFTGQSAPRSTRRKVSLRAKGRWCCQNLCRLFLIKVWFQMAVVLAVLGRWLLKRDIPATLASVAIILVLSTWMMSRERIRRSLSLRADDDWSTLDRPLLSLDEINNKRKAQERKDRIACRIGIVCTLLAGIVAMAGFRN